MTTDETSADDAAPEKESVVEVSEGQAYDASSIAVLEGLEAVRKRPDVCIGSTGERGLHHCVYGVVDNSVDEALAGTCDHIEMMVLTNEGLRMRGNGRGIPVNEHSTEHRPAVEVVITILHAGDKFGNGGYAVSGGLHGVGVSAVNALSTRMEVEARHDGYAWHISFENGVPTGPLERGKQTDEHGTAQTFWANPDIFEATHYNFETPRRRFQQMTFLSKGLRIALTNGRPTATPEGNEVVGETREGSPTPGCRNVPYMYSGGLLDYVKHLNAAKKVEIVHSDAVYFEAEDHERRVQCEVTMQCEVAIQWASTYSGALNTFANTVSTTEGGTYEGGFRSTLTFVIDKCARDKGLLKDRDPNLSGDDIREGLAAIISIKLGDPRLEGQTRTELRNTEARTFVQRQVYSHLTGWFDVHPDKAKDATHKVLQAFAARATAHKAREATRRKNVLESASMLGKLKDCTPRNPGEYEIFTVEGGSTEGSAANGRDLEHQATMPIRGKILNVEKARLNRALSSDMIQGLIAAFGADIGDEFDMAKLRCYKIVFMADADVDGSHIAALLLTLVYGCMRPPIEGGHVCLAIPPLYHIKWTNAVHDCVFSDREHNEKLVEDKNRGFRLPREESQRIQRYKGLGGMSTKELWGTTMNPETRTLKQVSIDGAAATSETFSILMGEDVEPR